MNSKVQNFLTNCHKTIYSSLCPLAPQLHVKSQATGSKIGALIKQRRSAIAIHHMARFTNLRQGDKQMRILHVTETVKGGVGNYLFDLALHQQKAARVEAIGILLPEQYQELVPKSFAGSVSLLPPKQRSIFVLIKMALCMFHAIRAFKPDVLFVHSSFAGLLARAPMLLFGKPAKVVFVPHSWSFQMAAGQGENNKRNSIKSIIYVSIERLLMRCTDHVLCVSKQEKTDAESVGLNTAKCQVILTGLRDNLYGPIRAN